jgi:carbamoyl-phosphate synthase large subunit
VTPRERVLVLQVGNRGGPWVCRSLLRAGFDVVAAHEPGRLSGRSRYARGLIRVPPPERHPDLFLEAVERICRERSVDVVMPGADERVTGLLVAELPRPAGAVVVGPTLEQFESVCDKGTLHETAVAAGLDSPSSSVVPESGDTPSDWPPLPSVVKPCRTPIEHRDAPMRRTAVPVATPAERAAALAEIHEVAGDAIVEELIVGTAWRMHFVADGARTFAIPIVTERSYPHGAGMSSVQSVAPTSPDDLGAATSRLIAHLGYRGAGSLQFIERGGRFYIHDVSLRLPSSVALTIVAGLDMPRLAVELALGLSPPFPTSFRHDARYVWLGGELNTIGRLLRTREPASHVWQVVREMLGAATLRGRVLDQFSVSDPLPTVALAAHMYREARRDDGSSGDHLHGRRPDGG